MTATLVRLWAGVMALATVYDLLLGAWPYALAAAGAAALTLLWLRLDRRARDLRAAAAEDEDIRNLVSARWAEDWDSPEDAVWDREGR